MKHIITLAIAAILLAACAKMGEPDGGWYDEKAPYIVRTSPQDQSTNVTSRKINIYFNEYITIEDATEKVVVSPPQMESADITASGKVIKVELNDTLQPNTTYTIDFSDAISDNNEDNPLGNYTYTFSTGDSIDTLEVEGYVVEAENMEPIKSILVGLYSNLNDTAFTTQPMLRVSRTDSRGHFIIRGIAPGSYRIYALDDMDGNYMFNQKSEELAFSRDIIVPTSKPDIRQDTVWRDSLHIETIKRVPYTHFLPDDIVLRAFTETLTDRYFIKAERKKAEYFTLFFSYGSDEMPKVKGLNFDASGNALVMESSEEKDTITYWLRDTMLVNQDTLNIELTYLATDTLGNLQQQTDTLEILSRETYEKRQKQREREYEEWKKKQKKAEKRGEAFDTIMPKNNNLEMAWLAPAQLDPDRNITVKSPYPIETIDSAKLHLYSKIDTSWYRSPFIFREKAGAVRTYELLGEWRPGIEYSLEVDSAAFIDIYGKASKPLKQGFRVRSLDEYGTLFFTFTGLEDSTVVVELLNTSDAAVKRLTTTNGRAEFFYINPGTYYLRMFIDSNGNGQWDTGLYSEGRQAEKTFYYPKQIDCRAKWDITLTWDTGKVSPKNLKPGAITKQKADETKEIKHRNAERARKLGIKYVPEEI